MIMTGKCDGILCHIPEEQSPQVHPHENLRTFVLVPAWCGSKQNVWCIIIAVQVLYSLNNRVGALQLGTEANHTEMYFGVPCCSTFYSLIHNTVAVHSLCCGTFAMLLLHLDVCHVTPRMFCCSHLARLPPPHTMQCQCSHNILPRPLLTLYCDGAPLPHLLPACRTLCCSCFARPLTRHSMKCCCSTSTPAMYSQSTLMQPPCQIAHHQMHPDTGLSACVSADHPIHRQFTTSDMRLLCNYTLHVQANHNRVYIYISLFIT